MRNITDNVDSEIQTGCTDETSKVAGWTYGYPDFYFKGKDAACKHRREP